jgi:hypothetical protein
VNLAWFQLPGDCRDYPRGYIMTTHMTFDESLRILIREKLASGRLARNGIQEVSGGPGKEQTCVACGTTIGKSQFATEGISSGEHRRKTLQFHAVCFSIWDSERRVLEQRVLGGVKPGAVNGHTNVAGT